MATRRLHRRYLPSSFHAFAPSPQLSVARCKIRLQDFGGHCLSTWLRVSPGLRERRPATTLNEFGVNFAVEKTIGIQLLDRVAGSEPIAEKLRAIKDVRWPVQFSHVIQAAQPFLAGIIADASHRLASEDPKGVGGTIWIL